METLTDKDTVNTLTGSGENDFTPPDKDRVVSFTKWVNEPTLEDLKADFTAVQSTHDAHTEKVSEWLDNLYVTGKAAPKKNPGKSSVQPKLIRKQAEWRYAALSEPFLSTDDMFSASPVTWEDKLAAEQNQLILNTQFRRDINRTAFIDKYVRAAVNEGTAILRTGWSYREKVEVKLVPQFIYPTTTNPEHIQKMETLAVMFQEAPHEFEKVAEEYKTALSIIMEEGRIVFPKYTGDKEEEVTIVLENKPTVEVCDFDEVMVDPTCKGDMSKANFVIYRFESSIAELKKAGIYENLDYIHVKDSSNIFSMPDENSNEEEVSSFTFKDAVRKKFYVYEYWGFWDINKDGVLVPIVATFVDDVIIRMQENPFPNKKLPFILVPYLPIKNSVYGEPDGVLIEDNQKIAGAVTRGMIDIMGRSANGQMGIRKDMLDPMNRNRFMKGLDYEFNPTVDARQGVVNHVFPEIPQSAQYMLNLQNVEAESLTGVKAFSGGLSGDSLGEVATAVRGVLDAASKRELGILRRLADGIVEVGRMFISMNSEFLEEEEVVRITNDQFVPVRRDDLAGKIDLKLDITTAEEDNQKAQELAFMLQTVGPSSDPGEVKIIRAEIAKLRKMPALAKAIEEYKPEPDPVQQQIQMLEIMKLQAEIEEIKSRTVENYAEAQLDQAKAGQAQSAKDMADLNFVEQESGTKHARDVEKITAQARSQTEKSIIEKAIDKRVRDQEKTQQEQ